MFQNYGNNQNNNTGKNIVKLGLFSQPGPSTIKPMQNSLFGGGNNQSSVSLFGGGNTQSTGTSLFGGVMNQPQQQQIQQTQQSNSIFGGGGMGQSTNSSSLFGISPQTQQQQGGMFGGFSNKFLI